MNMTVINVGWQQAAREKLAAAMQMNTNDTEKLFFEQSYTHVQNTAEPLMRPEYRVGFEIVYTNDNSTRLTGLYIFRIGNTLLYVPVFYINGTIKGADMLYRTDTKTFVLLDPDWCDYLIQAYTPSTGTPMDRSDVASSRTPPFDINKILVPPGTYKAAAAAIWPEMQEKIAALITDLGGNPREKQAGRILKSLMLELGTDGLQMLKSACERVPEFNRALFDLLPTHCAFPEEALGAVEKRASEGPKPWITVHRDPIANPNVKQASSEDLAKGYVIEDNRPETEKQAMVYEDALISMEEFYGPGEAKVHFADGKVRKCFVARLMDEYFLPGEQSGDCMTVCPEGPYGEGPQDPRCAQLRIISMSGDKAVGGVTGPVLAEEIFPTPGEGTFVTTPKKGKGYALYVKDKGMFFGKTFLVKEKKGNTFTVIPKARTSSEGGGNPDGWQHWEEYTFHLNPDAARYDLKRGFLNDQCVFMEVAYETKRDGDVGMDNPIYESNAKKLPQPLNISEVYSLMRGDGYRPIRMKSAGYDIHIDGEGINHVTCSPVGAKLRLMGMFGMKEATTDEMLEACEKQNGSWVGFQVKCATQLRWNDSPIWSDDFDPEFGVAMENEPQSFMTMADALYEKPFSPRVGDVTKLQSGMDVDALGGPAGVENFAKHVGMREIFEQGVVGALLKEFDAGSVIDRYMPDLEQGLDKLGRLLFLVYWKSDDFGRLFGTDDVSTMESSIQSTFKSMGRLVLDLLQKTRMPKTSEVDA